MSNRFPAAIIAGLACLLPAAFAQTPPLSSVAEIRAVSSPATALPPVVRLQGLITYKRDTQGFYLQDAAGEGVFVQPAPGEIPPETGAWVELRGQLSPGRFQPAIREAQILSRQATTNQPAARPTSFDQLMTGCDDAQFVELRGVVRTVAADTNRFWYIVGTGRGRVLAEIPRTAETLPSDQLEDASVKLLGVCENTYDTRKQLRGVRILLAHPGRLLVEKAGRPAASLPVHKASSVLRYSVEDDPAHRLRLRGIVSFCEPGKRVFLQDDTAGMLVKTLDPIVLNPGDEVEVLGYPALDKWIPFLQDGTFERLQTGHPPAALAFTAQAALATNHNAELLAMRGLLINHVARGGEWLLFLKDSNTVFTASLNQKACPQFPGQNGSLVELTGVCTVSANPIIGRLRSLNLLLRSPADIVVLAPPAWWTLDRALAAAGALVLATLASLLWGTTLRRRVRRQSWVIRERFDREAALQKKFRELFENASDPVFTTDTAGRLQSLNRAAEMASGFKLAAAGALRLAEWAVPGQEPRVEEWLRQAGQSEAPARIELELRRHEGGPATFDISARRILHAGQAVALQCIARDITARKQSETALAEAHRSLEATHAELSRINRQLEQSHLSLEQEIVERQRAQSELDRIHKQLLATAREAGMVEVSTGVLHNTANVLNSINVSAEHITESLNASHLNGLARIVVLLRDHAPDLETYVTRDEKGRQVGPFLIQLASHLASERTLLLEEINSLRKGVDHVTSIISTQQNYRTVSGLLERVGAAELIRDAVKVADPLLARHRISIQYELADLPQLTTDRHQMMQILVNLLRNAALACAESGRPDPRIVVRLAPGDPGRFKVEVEDNGVGISAANLTRIFNQGFSTRKDGHGFGLHSGALAAQSLGGTISVQSAGPGLGARFTLELPLDAGSRKEKHD